MHPAHGDVPALLGAAVTSFFATNLDGLAVLVPLVWSPPGGRRLPVLAGCCLGNAGVLALALIAAAGLGALPESQLRWVGLLPIGIGIYRLVPRRSGIGSKAPLETGEGTGGAMPLDAERVAESLALGVDEGTGEPALADPRVGGRPVKSLLALAGLTLALGGDNIAVLAPLLRALGPGGSAVIIVTHLVLFPLFLVLPVLVARSTPVPPRLARPASACLSIAIGAVIVAG